MKRGTVSSLQVGTAEYLAEKEFTLTALQLYHLQAFTWLLTFRTAIAMVSSGFTSTGFTVVVPAPGTSTQQLLGK